jgi:hypothetical protein
VDVVLATTFHTFYADLLIHSVFTFFYQSIVSITPLSAVELGKAAFVRLYL